MFFVVLFFDESIVFQRTCENLTQRTLCSYFYVTNVATSPVVLR